MKKQKSNPVDGKEPQTIKCGHNFEFNIDARVTTWKSLTQRIKAQ